MRKLCIKALLVITISVAGMQWAAAQSPKIGHINSAELLQMMNGVKEADAELQTYAKQLEDQNTAMLTEYQNKIQEFQGKQDLMADAVKEVKTKEIQDLELRIQTFQQTANDKLAAKKEELYSPILKKAEDAIKDVAKENKYTYVLDTSLGMVLFADESKDITDLVKKKLGIQ